MYWKTVELLWGYPEKKWFQEWEQTFCHSLKEQNIFQHTLFQSTRTLKKIYSLKISHADTSIVY